MAEGASADWKVQSGQLSGRRRYHFAFVPVSGNNANGVLPPLSWSPPSAPEAAEPLQEEGRNSLKLHLAWSTSAPATKIWLVKAVSKKPPKPSVVAGVSRNGGIIGPSPVR